MGLDHDLFDWNHGLVFLSLTPNAPAAHGCAGAAYTPGRSRGLKRDHLK